MTRPYLALILLVAATCLGYWHTTDVPFYLDDFRMIEDTPWVEDPSQPEGAWEFPSTRFVGFLSFALNHEVSGTNPAGYHVVNILIHFLAAAALWALMAALVHSPAFDEKNSGWLVWVPIISCLIFALHPLQTQAVTYVVQRFASLAAMFYLASMATFAWARLKGKHRWLLLSLAFALLAMFTKQNAATLPAALILIELIFFRYLGARARWAVVAMASVALAALVIAVNHPPLDALARESADIARIDYFSTQLGILWHYISTFFLPIDQRLEYSFKLVTLPWTALVYAQLAAHLALLIAGLLLWRRAPLLAFGILFYYLAHLVESSFLPISDFAVEHRTYLPNAGLSIVVASFIAWFISLNRMRIPGIVLTMILLGTAGWLTYKRNDLWRDPIAFLQEDARLNPDLERAWTSLGKELMRRMQFEEALDAFGNALNLARTEDGMEVRPNTLANTILALHYTGQHQKAFELAGILPPDTLTPVVLSTVLEARGTAMIAVNALERARRELERSLAAYPNPDAEASLAVLEYREGNIEKALEIATRVLDSVPDHPRATQLLKVITPTQSE